jgi:uncharacterized protein (UPF0218 family)
MLGFQLEGIAPQLQKSGGIKMHPQAQTETFGIMIDGEMVVMPAIPSVAAAEKLAYGFPGHGQNVAIVNRATGEIVQRSAPPPPA